jgi:hypothetical protein
MGKKVWLHEIAHVLCLQDIENENNIMNSYNSCKEKKFSPDQIENMKKKAEKLGIAIKENSKDLWWPSDWFIDSFFDVIDNETGDIVLDNKVDIKTIGYRYDPVHETWTWDWQLLGYVPRDENWTFTAWIGIDSDDNPNTGIDFGGLRGANVRIKVMSEAGIEFVDLGIAIEWFIDNERVVIPEKYIWWDLRWDIDILDWPLARETSKLAVPGAGIYIPIRDHVWFTISENALGPMANEMPTVLLWQDNLGRTDNIIFTMRLNRAHLHAENLIDLGKPVCTYWHKLYPRYCENYHLSSWEDTNGDNVLSPSDQIDMVNLATERMRWYHVDKVTVTLRVSKKPELIENMYVEFEGSFELMENAITQPVCTNWHEVWPVFSNRYHLDNWEDTNGDNVLSPSDQIRLVNIGTLENYWYHVDEVATDIIVTPKLVPHLIVSSVTGIPGDNILVNGRDFPENSFSEVLITLASGGIENEVARTTLDENGNFSTSFEVPDLPSDNYYLTAADNEGNSVFLIFEVKPVTYCLHA